MVAVRRSWKARRDEDDVVVDGDSARLRERRSMMLVVVFVGNVVVDGVFDVVKGL